MSKPYDLTALDPLELEALLHKRPDLRKDIFAEANRRHVEYSTKHCDHAPCFCGEVRQFVL
jgi:hypothetical protein